MRTSVVICTYNRAESLADVLAALQRQRHDDFEVVVVDGPSTDGTAALLRTWSDRVTVVENPTRNLSVSRNRGIAAASAPLIAFVDDDAIPEPGWLQELTAPFDGDDRLGACGGIVLDHTGTRVQWHVLVASRIGETDFDRRPPLGRYVGPGADPFLYVPGGNSAFRREALLEVGGFDEEIEYNFDETECCLRLHDAGWGFAVVDGARVHHRALPSHLRSSTASTDPFAEVKNHMYFGLRAGGRQRFGDALQAVSRRHGQLRSAARDAVRLGRMSAEDLPRYLGRADAGWHAGLQRGLHGERRSVVLPPPGTFRRFELLPARREPRLVVLGAPDEAARAAAARGREVRAVAVGDEHRIDVADGMWTRSVPAGPRWIPEFGPDPRVDGGEPGPARALAERIAALRGGLRASGAPADALPPWPVGLPAAARERLDDSARFPVDWEAVVRIVVAPAGAEDVADRAYRLLLGREPDARGRALLVTELRGSRHRHDVVRDLLEGVEARGRGIDPAVGERLPLLSATEAAAAVRRAWQLDDAGFVSELRALLRPGMGTPQGDLDRLRRGTSRRALASEHLATVPALERLSAAGMPPDDVWTLEELRTALGELRGLPATAFVDGAYRLLLGRPAGEDALPYVESIAGGGDRAALLRMIARSDEAAFHGSRAEVVEQLVASLPYGRDAAVARVRRRLARLLLGVRTGGDGGRASA